MAPDLLTPFDPYVKMNNELARATWQIKGGQFALDIFMKVASLVRDGDEAGKDYSFDIKDMGYNVLHGSMYPQIQTAAEELTNGKIRIFENKNFKIYNLFSMIAYENGVVTAHFDKDLIKFFINLSTFTQIELYALLNLPSGYSKRLFILLKSYAFKNNETIPLTELHEKLQTPGTYRSNFKNFRVWVLEKAQNDLKNILPFEYVPIKKGRAVEFIRFIFAPGERVQAQKTLEKEKCSKALKAKTEQMIEAQACVARKKGICGEDSRDNKKAICKVCLQLKMREEVRQKINNRT